MFQGSAGKLKNVSSSSASFSSVVTAFEYLARYSMGLLAGLGVHHLHQQVT